MHDVLIPIKTPEEIQIMTEGGKILAGIIRELKNKVQPGLKTKELDRLAESLILKSGGKCNFKGYQGFPSCLCVSVNEEVVHCVPSEKSLKEGDIVSLDLGMLYKGFHTDMAITLPVGKISSESQRLIKVTEEALKIGIKKAKIGNNFGDIGSSIQNYVESQKYNIVRELCGHGIGKELHEEPKVLNYGKEGEGPEIKEGMVFCIEPMVTVGHWKLTKKDEYCFVTKDSSLSAHFEHMVAITKNGPKILTEI
jgi:methionyl aminopeptidase